MNTHADKTQETKSQSVANGVSQKQSSGKSTFQFVDNRPEATQMRKLQEMANNSPQVKLLRAFQEMDNNSPQAKLIAQSQALANNYSEKLVQKKGTEEEELQMKEASIQKKASPELSRRENKTGLPDNLKAGVENLSGYSLDDVKVHRNSDKPAQVQAHAYAQGTNIHLASGQEKHLPHEAWHVVQQAQGRVKTTMQMKDGVSVNDDEGLREADAMEAKAAAGVVQASGQKGRSDPNARGQELRAYELAHVVQQDQADTPERQVIQSVLDERWKPEDDPLEDKDSALELYFRLTEEEKESSHGLSLLVAAEQLATDKNFNLKEAITKEIEELQEKLTQNEPQDLPDAEQGELLGGGLLEGTYLVELRGKQMVWKPEPSTKMLQKTGAPEAAGFERKGARISLRAEASSKIAKSLGANVLVATELSVGYGVRTESEKQQGVKRKVVTGQLMDFVKGTPLGDKSGIQKETKRKVKFDPKYVKDLFTLQLIDYITGQVDRHAADVLIGEAGVQALDHDFSLGKAVAERLRKVQETEKEFYEKVQKISAVMTDFRHIKYLPKYIDVSIADTLNAYDVGSLDTLVGKHLTVAELKAVMTRIEYAKNQLGEDMKVVKDWGDYFKVTEQPEAPKETKKKQPLRNLLRRKKTSSKKKQESTPPSQPEEFSEPVPYIQPKFHPRAQCRGQSDSDETRIQRVKMKRDLSLAPTEGERGSGEKYFVSHGDGNRMEADGEGVITATSNLRWDGGHTRIYLETVSNEKEEPLAFTVLTDLATIEEKSARDSVEVKIRQIQKNNKRLKQFEDEPTKRSWRTDPTNIANAQAKAEELQNRQGEYKFGHVAKAPGKSPVLNCAHFGEQVLRAAGIEASAGRVFKVPSVLTREPKDK